MHRIAKKNNINKKQKGMITVAFLTIFLIMFTLSFLVFIYGSFQKFYLKRLVLESIEQSLSQTLTYNYDEEEWYFTERDENGFLKEKTKINFSDKDLPLFEDEQNESLNLNIAETVKNKICNDVEQQKNKSSQIGMISILGKRDKYDKVGNAKFTKVNKDGTELIETYQDTENSIRVTTHFIRVDFTSNDQDKREILFSEKRLSNQTMLSNCVVMVKVVIKSAYPTFLFLQELPYDEFNRGTNIVKRQFFETEYITGF